jgi:RNA polymerase sigma-70 factor (ECF subfamily)
MNWWPEAERPQAIREALQQIEAKIPRLRRYARYLGYEPDHADDLVQGRPRARSRGDSHGGREGPHGAARHLATRLAVRHPEKLPHRGDSRGQRLDAPTSTHEASSPTTRRNQGAGTALPTLCDAYLSLSEERREVLLLVAIDGFQHEEAAAILGVPLGAVRCRLSQGRQALRQALEAGRATTANRPPAHRIQPIGT